MVKTIRNWDWMSLYNFLMNGNDIIPITSNNNIFTYSNRNSVLLVNLCCNKSNVDTRLRDWLYYIELETCWLETVDLFSEFDYKDIILLYSYKMYFVSALIVKWYICIWELEVGRKISVMPFNHAHAYHK